MFHAVYNEFQPVTDEEEKAILLVKNFGKGLVYDSSTRTLSLSADEIKEMLEDEEEEDDES